MAEIRYKYREQYLTVVHTKTIVEDDLHMRKKGKMKRKAE
jgi:hypothetical protein